MPAISYCVRIYVHLCLLFVLCSACWRSKQMLSFTLFFFFWGGGNVVLYIFMLLVIVCKYKGTCKKYFVYWNILWAINMFAPMAARCIPNVIKIMEKKLTRKRDKTVQVSCATSAHLRTIYMHQPHKHKGNLAPNQPSLCKADRRRANNRTIEQRPQTLRRQNVQPLKMLAARGLRHTAPAPLS